MGFLLYVSVALSIYAQAESKIYFDVLNESRVGDCYPSAHGLRLSFEEEHHRRVISEGLPTLIGLEPNHSLTWAIYLESAYTRWLPDQWARRPDEPPHRQLCVDVRAVFICNGRSDLTPHELDSLRFEARTSGGRIVSSTRLAPEDVMIERKTWALGTAHPTRAARAAIFRVLMQAWTTSWRPRFSLTLVDSNQEETVLTLTFDDQVQILLQNIRSIFGCENRLGG